MTTINQQLILASRAMTGSDGSYFVVPGSTTYQLGRVVICNTDTNPHALTLNIASGTASTVGNTLIAGRIIAPGESYVSPELAGQVMPAGYALRGIGDPTMSLTVSGISII